MDKAGQKVPAWTLTGRWIPDCTVLVAGHAGKRAGRTCAGRACQHGRGVMDRRPLFQAVRVGWLEGGVPLIWVQAGSETQGSGLKNVRVSCVECQGHSNLQCTRQEEAKWKGQEPATGKCL